MGDESGPSTGGRATGITGGPPYIGVPGSRVLPAHSFAPAFHHAQYTIAPVMRASTASPKPLCRKRLTADRWASVMAVQVEGETTRRGGDEGMGANCPMA